MVDHLDPKWLDKGGGRLRVFHADPPQISDPIEGNDPETAALPQHPMH